MLQAAVGGYRNSNNTDVFINAPNSYFEPAFNIMFPLEFDIPDSTNAYIVIRVRSDDTGTNFENQDLSYQSRFTLIAKDVASGATVPAAIHLNNFHSGWNTSINPYFINIQMGTSKVIDCLIKDSENNDLINLNNEILVF